MMVAGINELLLGPSTCILAVGMAKHGFDSDLTAMRSHRFRSRMVGTMDGYRLELEVLTRRPVEDIGRLGRPVHVWRWCQEIFSRTLTIR